jgi:DNA-binding CsgD family transcriptional regulator
VLVSYSHLKPLFYLDRLDVILQRNHLFRPDGWEPEFTVLDLVRQVNDGRPSFRSGGSARVDLTAREADVLRCLVQGMSYKAVAKELGVSIDTVRSHIRAVYRKLQVRNVAEAVRRALNDRLV